MDSLENWIKNEAIIFSIDDEGSVNSAVDKLIASLNPQTKLLGYAEPLHGGEEFLILRNVFFRRLVNKHGYTAIALESGFTRGHIVNDYISGRSSIPLDQVMDQGFTHNFGKLDANRELVQWLQKYNSDTDHKTKITFYGMDSPTEMTGTDSPSHSISLVTNFLDSIDGRPNERRNRRIELLIGKDADWQNPEVMLDPAKSVGLSTSAGALRLEIEELITELLIRRPELVTKSDTFRYEQALQQARIARELMNYHAALAQQSETRISKLLGIRDAMIADNLSYAIASERNRGKVFAFAQNGHLQHGKLQWQLGPHLNVWWPAGSLLAETLGNSYTVIGSGLGVSEANGIGKPETNTLESMLTGLPGSAVFIPTIKRPDTAELERLDSRTGSVKNPTYTPLSSDSLKNFDWICVLDSVTCTRGGATANA